MKRSGILKPFLLLAVAIAGWVFSCDAQELEPRRWSHLPVGVNFVGLGYAYTSGDIQFDPVLRIEDVTLGMHTGVLKYIGTFGLFDKVARFDFIQGFQEASWEGLLDGAPASTSRSGFSDSVLRFSMNLIGAPALEGKEFAEYRKSVAKSETIVGVGLAMHLPTGHYLEDKLLNLGSNRFIFRPQVGLLHTRGNLSFEVTGSSWIFTDNDEFFDGNYLETKPLYTIQGHVVYTFRPGLWIGCGTGYGFGSESTINGVDKDDRRGNAGFGVSVGIPLSKKVGFKLGYVGFRAREDVGANLDTYVGALSFMW